MALPDVQPLWKFAPVLHNGGERNVVLQVVGVAIPTMGVVEWQQVLTVSDIPANGRSVSKLSIDTICYSIAEGCELIIGWGNSEEFQPVMPLAGRGKMTFDEIRSVHAMLKGGMEFIKFRVAGEPKNEFPVIFVGMEFTPHFGGQ